MGFKMAQQVSIKILRIKIIIFPKTKIALENVVFVIILMYVSLSGIIIWALLPEIRVSVKLVAKISSYDRQRETIRIFFVPL